MKGKGLKCTNLSSHICIRPTACRTHFLQYSQLNTQLPLIQVVTVSSLNIFVVRRAYYSVRTLLTKLTRDRVISSVRLSHHVLVSLQSYINSIGTKSPHLLPIVERISSNLHSSHVASRRRPPFQKREDNFITITSISALDFSLLGPPNFASRKGKISMADDFWIICLWAAPSLLGVSLPPQAA